MRGKTTVELKVNMFRGSEDYLRPFGYQVVRGDRVLKSYLLHEWRLIWGWPSVPQRTKDWLERVAKEHGWS